MPTYSYACTECGHRFDAQQSFTDDALTQCPQCSGRLRKMFGNVGVVFKGSGFYRNDARKGPVTSGSGSKASSGGASGGASTAGSESSGSSTGASSGSSGSGSSGSGSSGAGSPGAGSPAAAPAG